MHHSGSRGKKALGASIGGSIEIAEKKTELIQELISKSVYETCIGGCMKIAEKRRSGFEDTIAG